MTELKSLITIFKKMVSGEFDATMPTVAAVAPLATTPTNAVPADAIPAQASTKEYVYEVIAMDGAKYSLKKKEQANAEAGDIITMEDGTIASSMSITMENGDVVNTDEMGVVVAVIESATEQAIEAVTPDLPMLQMQEDISILKVQAKNFLEISQQLASAIEKICAQPVAMAATIKSETLQDKIAKEKEDNFFEIVNSIKNFK